MIEKGMLIAGRYEILDKIGTGGMSDVFKAMDTSLSREVALKVLKDEYITDMGFVSKFRQEATAAAGLEHPNIVNIYDVGNEDGHHFIVMEYVEGITLKTYIAKKGHLSNNELLSIAIQVGRGIEAAHNKNIIHRDIKPQNIIISKEGKVKVTDFGIARAVTSNTINADRMGSVHYSSPEQARNGYVTYQSDIYSLGIVMYEMCTGRVPYDGDTTVAVAIQHLQSEMVPPSQLIPGVPISVEKIILRATMKNPERRYETITLMLTDLKKALVNPDEDFVYIPPASASFTGQMAPQPGESATEKGQPQVVPASIPAPEDINPEKNENQRPASYDEDDEEDEDGVSSKMDKAVTFMGIAAAIVIILIVIYLCGSFFGFFSFGKGGEVKEPVVSESVSESTETETVKVPSVLGYTEEMARSIIEDSGFKYKKLGEASSEEYEAGQIMEQYPNGGDEKEPGETVEVMVSSGQGNIPIPTVTGFPQDQAMSTIDAAGFAVNVMTEYSSDVEQGKVIRQSPTGNEKANEGDTITIWVSRGNEVKPVPNVVGKTQEEAEKILKDDGFTVTVQTETSDSVEAGNVIRQTPTAQAESGTNVTIVVSEGGRTYYKYSVTLYPIDEMDTYVVLRDEAGEVLVQQVVTEPITMSLSNLSVPSGIIYYYNNEDRVTEIAPSEQVTFEVQQ